MSKNDATWREDDSFKEFGSYTNTPALYDVSSSGYTLIGAGGRDIDEDCDFNEAAVKFYLQFLDSGEDMEFSLTPESARDLARHLNKWADDAETTDEDIETIFERQRSEYYAKGGL